MNDRKRPFSGKKFFMLPNDWQPLTEFKKIQDILKKGNGEILIEETSDCCYVVCSFQGVSLQLKV